MSRCEREAWLAVVAWAVLIYTTVPVVDALQRWVKDWLGSAVFLYLTVAGLVIGAIAGVIFIRRANPKLGARSSLWLAAVATVAIGWAVRLRGQPQEAVHLLEYGVLGMLAANALRHRTKDWTLYLQAILVGAILGIFDEVFQWLTPQRYFDFRDFWLNGGAVALVQLALWKGGLIPATETVSPASVHRLCRLGMVYLALLGTCLSMTPTVVEGLAARAPLLASRVDQEDAMAEYGHRHVVQGTGTFKSRFTLPELHELDRSRGIQAGTTIRPIHKGGPYRHFFKEASRAKLPFEREARLHVACRNENIRLAGESEDEIEKRYRITRAVREDRILQTFFQKTVNSAGLRLGPNRRAELEAAADPEMPFYSMADRHLITFASQRQLLGVLGLMIVALAVTDRMAGHGGPRSTVSSY